MSKELLVNDKVDKLIAGELHGLDDFEKITKITELTEVFCRDVPSLLAELRVTHLRRLSEIYTQEQIQTGTGLSPSRIRKLMER